MYPYFKMQTTITCVGKKLKLYLDHALTDTFDAIDIKVQRVS